MAECCCLERVVHFNVKQIKFKSLICIIVYCPCATKLIIFLNTLTSTFRCQSCKCVDFSYYFVKFCKA